MGRSRRKNEEAGFWMLVAEAILGVVLGGLLAAMWLAVWPVEIADAPPEPKGDEPRARHSVVYVKGRESPVRPAEWKRKQQAFLSQDAKGVELVEQDVNRWVSTEFGNIDLKREWESIALEYRGSLPNFRFDGALAIVGVVSQVKAFGAFERKLVVQAEGDFRERDGRFEFEPKKMRVGALPIPTEALRSAIGRLLLTPFVPSETFASSWKRVHDVRLEEGRMKLGFSQPVPALASDPEPAEVTETVAADAEELPAAVEGATSEIAAVESGESVEVPNEAVAPAESGSVESSAADPMASEETPATDPAAGQAIVEEAPQPAEESGTEAAITDAQPVEAAPADEPAPEDHELPADVPPAEVSPGL